MDGGKERPEELAQLMDTLRQLKPTVETEPYSDRDNGEVIDSSGAGPQEQTDASNREEDSTEARLIQHIDHSFEQLEQQLVERLDRLENRLMERLEQKMEELVVGKLKTLNHTQHTTT